MPSEKRINSVCHSIAHHAVSGLSFIHPHIGEACRNAGVEQLEVNLLAPEPCPELFRNSQPLLHSLRALKNKLFHILAAEGFSIEALSSAQLTFFRDPAFKSDYCTICHAKLTSIAGRTYEHRINCIGEPKPVNQSARAEE